MQKKKVQSQQKQEVAMTHNGIRHVVRAQRFDRRTLDDLFCRADSLYDQTIAAGSCARPFRHSLTDHRCFSFFVEESTRTRNSFEVACVDLGIQVVSTSSAKYSSSIPKGESIEDTIRTLCAMRPSFIIFRSENDGDALRAAKIANRPIISGGDGAHQHPSQSLLDLFTIHRELNRLDDLTVAICGDLYNGRTIRSLAYLLSKYQGIRLIFVAAHEDLRMKPDIKEHLDERGIPYDETDDMEAALREADVFYQTRIQRNRMAPEEFETFRASIGDTYDITVDRLQLMQKHARLLHPFPRNNEIRVECDGDPRAAYYRQIEYGVFVRMALIEWVLNVTPET